MNRLEVDEKEGGPWYIKEIYLKCIFLSKTTHYLKPLLNNIGKIS